MEEFKIKIDLNQDLMSKNIQSLTDSYKIDLPKLKATNGLLKPGEKKPATATSPKAGAMKKLVKKSETGNKIDKKKRNLAKQILIFKIKLKNVRLDQSAFLSYFYRKNMMIELLVESEALKMRCVKLLKKWKKAYFSSKDESHIENMRTHIDKWKTSTEKCKNQKQKYINIILNTRQYFKAAFKTWQESMNVENVYLKELDKLTRMVGTLDRVENRGTPRNRRRLGDFV